MERLNTVVKGHLGILDTETKIIIIAEFLAFAVCMYFIGWLVCCAVKCAWNITLNVLGCAWRVTGRSIELFSSHAPKVASVIGRCLVLLGSCCSIHFHFHNHGHGVDTPKHPMQPEGDEGWEEQSAPLTPGQASRPAQVQQKTVDSGTPTPDTKNKKANKKADPDAPSKPTPPFGFYTANEWARHKALHPNSKIKMQEMSVKLGEQWKALTHEEKQPYFDMHKKDTERYEMEYSTYEIRKASPSRA